MEDWFRRLDKYGCPLQVSCFNVESEVNFLIDALKKYDPDYDESVQRKLCMKKITFIF